MCQARYLKRVLSDAGTMSTEEEEAQVERRWMLWRCKEVKKSGQRKPLSGGEAGVAGAQASQPGSPKASHQSLWAKHLGELTAHLLLFFRIQGRI